MPQVLAMTVTTRKPAVGPCIEGGSVGKNGYSTVTVDGRTRNAHRVAYEQRYGPIADGLHLDHLCRNRPCVNPEHLEPVTQAENNRRAAEDQATCANGHPRTPDNLIVEMEMGAERRRCQVCRRADRARAGRQYRATHRDKINADQRARRASQKATS